jgi:hypothetical protein
MAEPGPKRTLPPEKTTAVSLLLLLHLLLLLDLSLNFWQISIFLMFFGRPSRLNICGRKSDWNLWKINVVNTSHAPYGTWMNLGSHVVPVLRTSDGPMRYIVAMEISQAFQDGPAAKHAALRQGGHKRSKTRNTKRSLTPIGCTMMVMIGSYNIS